MDQCTVQIVAQVSGFYEPKCGCTDTTFTSFCWKCEHYHGKSICNWVLYSVCLNCKHENTKGNRPCEHGLQGAHTQKCEHGCTSKHDE